MLKEQILLEYACGGLTGAHSALVAAHLTMNPESRAIVSRFEDLGGHALEQGKQSSLKTSADDLFAKIDASAGFAAPSTPTEIAIDQSVASLIPAPLRAFATSKQKPIEMKPLFPGYAKSILTEKSDPIHAEFLQIGAGKDVAEHTHRGMELTLILDGAFEDETGRYEAGSLIVTDEHIHHKPTTDAVRGCFCFTTRSEPLRFTGAFGGILNAIFKR